MGKLFEKIRAYKLKILFLGIGIFFSAFSNNPEVDKNEKKKEQVFVGNDQFIEDLNEAFLVENKKMGEVKILLKLPSHHHYTDLDVPVENEYFQGEGAKNVILSNVELEFDVITSQMRVKNFNIKNINNVESNNIHCVNPEYDARIIDDTNGRKLSLYFTLDQEFLNRDLPIESPTVIPPSELPRFIPFSAGRGVVNWIRNERFMAFAQIENTKCSRCLGYDHWTVSPSNGFSQEGVVEIRDDMIFPRNVHMWLTGKFTRPGLYLVKAHAEFKNSCLFPTDGCGDRNRLVRSVWGWVCIRCPENQLPTKPTISMSCLSDGRVSLSVPSGYTSYVWQRSSQSGWSNVGSNSRTYTVLMGHSGDYRVRVSNMCGEATSDSFTVSAQSLTPSPTLIGNDSFCSGSSMPLFPDRVYEEYQWYSGTGSGFAIPNANNHALIVSSPNDYWVRVKTGACYRSSNRKSIRMIDSPSSDFSVSPPLLKLGETIELNAIYSNGKQFRWDFGDGNIQITTNYRINYTYLNTGNYNISLRTQNHDGCWGPITQKQVEVFNTCCGGAFPLSSGSFQMEKRSGRFIYQTGCGSDIPLDCFLGPADPITTNKVVSSSATTYSDKWDYNESKYVYRQRTPEHANDFERGKQGKWRPEANYVFNTQLNNEEENFSAGTYNLQYFNWQAPANSNSKKWLKTSTIEAYSPHGEALQERNALGIPSAVKYGYHDALPYLTAQNAELDEVFFESFENLYGDNAFFEDGMENNTLNFTLFSPSNLPGDVTAHSGSNYVGLEPSPSSRLRTRSFRLTPKIREKGLLVKFWAYVNNPTVDNNIIAQNVEIQLRDGSLVRQKIRNAEFVAQSGEWKLFSVVIKDFGTLSLNGAFTPTVTYLGGEMLYIDDVRIQPIDAQMTTYVYDPKTLRLLTVFDDQHFGLYYQYNAEGKLVRKQKETERGMKTIHETQYNMPKVAK
jgi:hypothetical protein